MSAASGVWSTFANLENDLKKVEQVRNKIDEIFFGSNCVGCSGATLMLPNQFTEKYPVRGNICGSKIIPNEIPSASDSLAWAILCLCMGSKNSEGLCGSVDESRRKWPDDRGESIEVLENVWCHGNWEGVMKHCGNSDEDVSFEKRKQNLNSSLKILKSVVENKKGILGGKGITCDGSRPCATVTKKQTWLPKLEEIANLFPTPLPELEEKSIIEPEHTSKKSAISTVESIPATPPPTITAPGAESAYETVRTQDPLETHKQVARKAPEEKLNSAPVQEKNPTATAKHQEEKSEYSVPVSENETSSTFITNPKWLLIAALLI